MPLSASTCRTIYAKTKRDLVTLLKEFRNSANGKIQLRMHENLEPFSEEATLAEQRYGIEPERISIRQRGRITEEQVILAAVFTCGMEKVIVPFFDHGIPVEYELIRSIDTVAQPGRKRLGIVNTDAQLFGGFSFAGGQPRQIPKHDLVVELEKQYNVEDVDANNPIDVDKYAALVCVQPSSLSPEQFANFLEAVRQGAPTAIFEDPLPWFLTSVPGTGQPKQAPGGGMMGQFGGGQPMPKGDIQQLWTLLGLGHQGTTKYAHGRLPARSLLAELSTLSGIAVARYSG